MYQGTVIYPRLRDLYAATVRKELLLPIVERELAELQRFVVRYSMSDKEATQEEYAQNFDRLRLYLLVSGPGASGEPGLDEEEKKWLTEHVGDLWAKPMRIAGDGATLSNIEAVAAAYIDMLAVQPELAFERDTKLVERVQRVLKRSDRSKAVAQALIDAVDGPSLRLRDMVAISSIRNQDRVIRPAFTRRGYEEQVKARLEGNMDDLLDEQWVLGRLGEDGDRLRDEEITAIKTEYFRRYIVEWRTFIDSIYIEAPNDYVDALGLLVDLTRTEPYKDLFSHIAYHTQLADLNAPAGEDDTEDALLKEVKRQADRKVRQKLQLNRIGVNQRMTQLAARRAMEDAMRGQLGKEVVLTEYEVTYAFLGLAEFGARKTPPPQADPSAPPPPPEDVPLDDYQEQLAFVRDALQERLDDPAESDKLGGRLKAARSKVKSLLSSQDASGWQPTFEKLLWPPIDIVVRIANQDLDSDLGNKWCNDVVASFERSIAKRYPFNPTGHDVAAAEARSRRRGRRRSQRSHGRSRPGAQGLRCDPLRGRRPDGGPCAGPRRECASGRGA